jgi:hypothetical protein
VATGARQIAQPQVAKTTRVANRRATQHINAIVTMTCAIVEWALEVLVIA